MIAALGILFIGYPLLGNIEDVSPYLFCLTPDTEPFTEKQLMFGKTNIPSLDSLLAQNPGAKIRPWLPASEPHEHVGNIYLNRIYQISGLTENKSSLEHKMESLAKDPYILYTEKEPIIRLASFKTEESGTSIYTPNDPLYSQQWWIRQIEANKAWGLWDIEGGETPGQKNVKVAIVDTGVEWTHPDLIHNIWQNLGEDANGNGKTIVNINGVWQLDPGDINGIDNDENGYIDDLIGWDLEGSTGVQDDNDPMAILNGEAPLNARMHGTHCAGIVSATADNEIGIAGTAFNVSLIPIKVMADNNEDGNITSGYAGIQYAYKTGANIISLSWGSKTYSTSARSVIQTAKNAGCILVASAGNGTDEGFELYEKFYPASYPEVISVTALGPNDKWGKWANYHEDVDIAAPGENILSTVFSSVGSGDSKGYQAWWGTSMAAPIVAGSMALLMSYIPHQTSDWYTNQLLDNTDDIYTINDNPEYDGRLGRGRVNLYKALGQAMKAQLKIQEQRLFILNDDGDGILNPGEQVQISLTLINELGWQDGKNIHVLLRSTVSDIVITDSLATFPDLKSGESGTHSEPLGFYVKPGSSLGDVYLECVILSENFAGSCFEDVLTIPLEISLYQKGFPVPLSELVVSTPLVWDINGDEKKEIVCGTLGGHLMAWTHTGDTLAGFPLLAGGLISGEIAAADLDNDGVLELVATTTSGKVIIFNGSGEILKTYQAQNSIVAAPSIGQIDGGDDLEIVVGTKGNQILAIKKDGSFVHGFPITTDGAILTSVSVADSSYLQPVLAYSTGNGELYLTNARGTPLPGWPVTFDGIQTTTPVLITYQEDLIVAVGLSNGDFVLLEENGSLRKTIKGSAKVLAEPTVVRTPDGPALAYPYDVRKIAVVNINGEFLPGWPLVFDQMSSRVGAGDLNNNGIDEIIGVSSNGKVAIWDIQGNMLPGLPIVMNENIHAGPTLSDLDNDGDAEILFPGNNHLFALDIKSEATASEYLVVGGLRGGGPLRTHRYDYIYTSMKNPLIPTEFKITGLYPNPFNHQAIFTWNQPQTMDVQLTVYDIRGRQISHEVIRGNLGENSFVLTGDGLSSGIYFLRLKADTRTDIIRFVFLK